MHRANDRDVVDRPGDVAKEVADFDAALAVLAEFEGRGQGGAGRALGGQHAAGEQLAGVLFEGGLGVEGIHMRRAAVHEDVDDVLGLCREMRHARREGVGARSGSLGSATDEVSEGERAEAHAAAMEQLAAGEGQVIELEGVGHGWGALFVVRGPLIVDS